MTVAWQKEEQPLTLSGLTVHFKVNVRRPWKDASEFGGLPYFLPIPPIGERLSQLWDRRYRKNRK